MLKKREPSTTTFEKKQLLPYIALFGELRSQGIPLPGVYDDALDVRVLKDNNKTIPLIRAYKGVETLTKTEAERESDENASDALLETMTKTEAIRESDDDRTFILDLMTKTFVERESDDDDHFLAEMYTKTKMDREGDDHHPEI